MKKEIKQKTMNNEQNMALVESAGFAFCRYGVMIIVWLAFIFRIKELVLLTFIILLFSAIFTVKYAPMVVIWRYSLGLIIKGKKEVLNVKAMRFAHMLGSVLSGACVILLYSGLDYAGWILTGILAIMKTISALGFCPASKLYVCMSSGGCCAISRKINSNKPK